MAIVGDILQFYTRPDIHDTHSIYIYIHIASIDFTILKTNIEDNHIIIDIDICSYEGTMIIHPLLLVFHDKPSIKIHISG